MWGWGDQVPDSHSQQLATGPALPAPHAGHARLIRPVRRRGGYITGDNSKVIMFGDQIPDNHLPQMATGPPLPALDVGHARLLQRGGGGGGGGGGGLFFCVSFSLLVFSLPSPSPNFFWPVYSVGFYSAGGAQILGQRHQMTTWIVSSPVV